MDFPETMLEEGRGINVLRVWEFIIQDRSGQMISK
jgi:hypothetical protein